MGMGVRRTLLTEAPRASRSNGHPPHLSTDSTKPAPASRAAEQKIRVLVTAENRLLREALARMLSKHPGFEVIALPSAAPLEAKPAFEAHAHVLLLGSRGSIDQDLTAIQHARTCFADARILLIGMTGDTAQFLQCVRAGIRGYLLRDASSDEVVAAVRAVHAGEAVCPGSLCSTLFRYFEHEASALPCGSVRQRLGLTRREQQLIPLIAQGLTNKEIANHFSLSEQTVKNHLYRMKHKTGAEDRLDIVQLYRTHTFLT